MISNDLSKTTTNKTMKLTTQTLSILNNFSSINDNVKLVPGRQQKTMTTMKNVLCEATLDED